MPAIPADAHTAEAGQPGSPAGWLGGTWEETPELTWPADVAVYDKMGRTDGQVAAVFRAITLPILAANWHLGTEGVDPRVVAFVAAELGLTPNRAAVARRRRHGIVWRDYLRHALLCLRYGHMPFEVVHQVDAPGADLAGIAGLPPLVAHLRKLAPRMPRSLSAIDVAPDGGLVGIRQLVTVPAGRDSRAPAWSASWSASTVEERPIPVAWLVMHTNDREGGDWRGTSILRASYKNWLIKDQLLRLGPMAVERNGMGLPVVTFDDQAGGSEHKALELARAARAGEDAGAALPAGYTLQLMGVTGSTKDELPLIHYHDQQIGKNTLAMFLDLGHDNGARSLGDTFVDFFALAQNAVADEHAETATEHVVRDLVALNFGDDEPYPPVLHDEISAEAALRPADLAALVAAGVVLPDDDLDAEIRRRFRLPAPNPVDVDVPAGPVPPPPSGRPLPPPGRRNATQLAESTARLAAAAENDRRARDAGQAAAAG